MAFDGDVAVGWCQLKPRHALPWLNARVARHVGDDPVWALSCLYVHRSCRRQGVVTALVAAAPRAASRAAAAVLQAYPVDSTVRGSTSNLFTGTASTSRRWRRGRADVASRAAASVRRPP
jgi:hypothetical protein